MRNALGIIVLVGLLAAATPTAFGGWAVVTLQEIPEVLEAGTPTTLAFKIRQHGSTLLDDRSPSVTLRNGSGGLLARFRSRTRFEAVRGSEPGLYVATVTPEEAGEVRITIETDVYGWKVQLLPMTVVAQGHRPAPMSVEDRGRQLFAAKGCATCHAKKDDRSFSDFQVVQVGPNLTGRRYPLEFLAQKLTNPGLTRPISSNTPMPTLTLNDEEIHALINFINHGPVATAGGS